jgi:hypothetical protein
MAKMCLLSIIFYFNKRSLIGFLVRLKWKPFVLNAGFFEAHLMVAFLVNALVRIYEHWTKEYHEDNETSVSIAVRILLIQQKQKRSTC